MIMLTDVGKPATEGGTIAKADHSGLYKKRECELCAGVNAFIALCS